jgi:hypothetical protein
MSHMRVYSSQSSLLKSQIQQKKVENVHIFSSALQPRFGPWPTSMKLSVSLQFSRSQTSGRTPWVSDQLGERSLNTNHPCPEWDSNPRSRLPII